MYRRRASPTWQFHAGRRPGKSSAEKRAFLGLVWRRWPTAGNLVFWPLEGYLKAVGRQTGMTLKFKDAFRHYRQLVPISSMASKYVAVFRRRRLGGIGLAPA